MKSQAVETVNPSQYGEVDRDGSQFTEPTLRHRPLSCFGLLLGLLLGVLSTRVSRAEIPDFLAESETPGVNVVVKDAEGSLVEDYDAYWLHNQVATQVEPVKGVLKISQPAGLVVVHKSGFRYGGAVLANSKKSSIDVTLRSTSDGGEGAEHRPSATRGLPFTPSTSQALKQVAQERLWEAVRSDPKSQYVGGHFELLARLDPQEVLQYLRENKVDRNSSGMARQSAVQSLAKTDFAAAVELVDEEKNAMFRSFLLSALMNALPLEHPGYAAIESQWADTIREIDQPALRLTNWAVLGEHYLLTGRESLASKIVDQHLDHVKKLPAGGWSGFPRSLFAALIVTNDLPQAEKLIRGLDKNESDRALGRLAFYVCRTDPDAALRLLGQIDTTGAIGFPYHCKVVHRLALEHPNRAREVAEKIDDARYRAVALGKAAMRLAESEEKELASEFLMQATKDLEEMEPIKVLSYSSVAEMLAGLLPVVERVAPHELESTIWQVVWHTIPRTRWTDGSTTINMQLSSVASAVARFDAALATELVGRPSTKIRRAAGQSFNERDVKNRLALDAEKLLRDLAKQEALPTNHRTFEVLVELLDAEPQEFWNEISRPYLVLKPSEKFEEM